MKQVVMSGVQSGSAICPLNTLSGGRCMVSGHLFERQTHRRHAPSSVRWFSCKEDSSLLQHQKPIEKHGQRRQIQNQTKSLKTHQRPHTSPGGIPNCRLKMLVAAAPPLPPSHPLTGPFPSKSLLTNRTCSPRLSPQPPRSRLRTTGEGLPSSSPPLALISSHTPELG